MPELDEIEVNQRPKTERLNHGQSLCAYEQTASLQAINDGAADSAQ
jgi:hypothetical protein